MDFTLHQLRIFGTVARHRSMTKAAKELHMTQPAVSIQIKQLQQAAGIPLFEVISHRIHLTEAGRHMERMYRTMSDEIQSFQAVSSQLKGGLEGTLTISAASTAKYFLPYLLGAFKQKYPGVRIVMKVKDRDEVLAHLKHNEYDLAILSQIPGDRSVECFPFLDNPLVLCSAPDHPLAQQSGIQIDHLKSESFIFREPGSGTRMVMERYLESNGIFTTPAMELATNEAVKQAIMAGIGISFISGLSTINELELEKIAVLDVDGLPLTTRWHALYKKEKKLSPVTRNFLTFLQQRDMERIIP